MIGTIKVELLGGQAIVHVDGQLVDARVRVTFKRDGALSTLRIGSVVALPDPCASTQQTPEAG